MPRQLVLTALEETWPAVDTSVVFLGEWCKLYSRTEIWSKYNSQTLPYHWDDREKLYNDYLYVRNLYEIVIKDLAVKLNEIHGVGHSDRYWRILVGPWLGYFIQMVYDRYLSIKNAIGNQDIECRFINYQSDLLVPNDMTHFTKLFVSDDWNQYIYQSILSFIGIVPQGLVSFDVARKNFLEPEKSKESLVNKILNWQSQIFVAEEEAFIQSTYLPTFKNILFQVSLYQIPRIRLSRLIPAIHFHQSLRNFKLEDNSKNEFIRILYDLIPKNLPKVILEGYHNLKQVTESYKWPKNPKFIFTSNSHNADDLFKFYVAEKVEMNTKFFLGQHGGHYGVGKWSFLEDHETETCDRYISWGWQESKNPKVKEFASLKLIGSKEHQIVKEGNLLLVSMSMPRYSYWMYSAPVGKQWLSYFNDQVRFVSELNEKIQSEEVVVRLSSSDYGWDQNKRWRKRFPKIQLDSGEKRIEKLVQNCRLYVSTYNATTFLESMGNNTPTIIFWNPKHWEIRDSAIPFFEKLKRVGIFHETPEGAAQMVNKVWNHIPEWWYSKETQEARDEFCQQYAKKIKKPLSVLKELVNI
ncbi:LIC12162 family protein [Leptospira sp. 96542]|nr:LIC12162 family protein [Leptospira sp. 96542]